MFRTALSKIGKAPSSVIFSFYWSVDSVRKRCNSSENMGDYSIQSLLLICVFGYTRLRKIINVKKIVWFMTRKSVVHDFRACPNENCSIYNAEIRYT